MADHPPLTDFRSYAEARARAGAGFVLLSGDNGAGKTNILEAVSLACPRPRAARSALSRDGADAAWPSQAAFASREQGSRRRQRDVGTGTLAAAPERRQVRINGAPAAVNSLGEWLAVLWLTPAMDRLFAGSAGDRRRFLDRLVLALEPGHAHHSARYEAAMRARNKLLAERRARRTRLAGGARSGHGRAWRRDWRSPSPDRRRAG